MEFQVDSRKERFGTRFTYEHDPKVAEIIKEREKLEKEAMVGGEKKERKVMEDRGDESSQLAILQSKIDTSSDGVGVSSATAPPSSYVPFSSDNPLEPQLDASESPNNVDKNEVEKTDTDVGSLASAASLEMYLESIKSIESENSKNSRRASVTFGNIPNVALLDASAGSQERKDDEVILRGVDELSSSDDETETTESEYNRSNRSSFAGKSTRPSYTGDEKERLSFEEPIEEEGQSESVGDEGVIRNDHHSIVFDDSLRSSVLPSVMTDKTSDCMDYGTNSDNPSHGTNVDESQNKDEIDDIENIRIGLDDQQRQHPEQLQQAYEEETELTSVSSSNQRRREDNFEFIDDDEDEEVRSNRYKPVTRSSIKINASVTTIVKVF